MRADLPMPASRAALSGAATEDARPLASAAEAAARRREESASRRQASANRLLGAVARHLQDDVDDELQVDDATADGSSGAGHAVGASDGGRSHATRIAGGGLTRPRRTVRRAATACRRGTAPTEDVWTQGTEAADAASAVAGPQVRIQRHRPVSRIGAVQAESGAAPQASGGRRIASWGAVLAAVVALAVMMAAGWFERLTNPEGNGPDAPPETSTQAEPR